MIPLCNIVLIVYPEFQFERQTIPLEKSAAVKLFKLTLNCTLLYKHRITATTLLESL